jgi:hypothetical protein
LVSVDCAKAAVPDNRAAAATPQLSVSFENFMLNLPDVFW